MKELGFVILEDGRIIPFGEFKCTNYRDNSNKRDFHSPAFREDVLEKFKEYFTFINDIENFDIISENSFLGKNGIVTLLNITGGAFEPSSPTMLMIVPKTTSVSQKKALISVESTMDYFDTGVSFINVIDSDGEVVTEYDTINEFYESAVGYDYQSKFDLEEAMKRFCK